MGRWTGGAADRGGVVGLGGGASGVAAGERGGWGREAARPGQGRSALLRSESTLHGGELSTSGAGYKTHGRFLEHFFGILLKCGPGRRAKPRLAAPSTLFHPKQRGTVSGIPA